MFGRLCYVVWRLALTISEKTSSVKHVLDVCAWVAIELHILCSCLCPVWVLFLHTLYITVPGRFGLMSRCLRAGAFLDTFKSYVLLEHPIYSCGDNLLWSGRMQKRLTNSKARREREGQLLYLYNPSKSTIQMHVQLPGQPALVRLHFLLHGLTYASCYAFNRFGGQQRCFPWVTALAPSRSGRLMQISVRSVRFVLKSDTGIQSPNAVIQYHVTKTSYQPHPEYHSLC